MEVKRGRLVLRSDSSCYWIDEEYEVTNKDGKVNKYTRNVSGYYATIEALANGFANHRLRDTESATSMRKLTEQVKALKKQIEKLTVDSVDTIAKVNKERSRT